MWSSSWVLLGMLIALPFATYRLLQYLTHLLNRLRQFLIHLHTQGTAVAHSPYLTLALLIRRSAHYLPWVMMLLALWLADALLVDTDLAEIAVVIPYISFYVGYRLFETLLFAILSSVSIVDSADSVLHQKLRLRRTTRQIGLFFLISFIIAHATEDVVGRALVYRIVTDMMLYLGLIVCAHALRGWRLEIGAAAEETLPDSLGPRLQQACAGKWSWVMCLPTLVLVLGLRSWHALYAWLSRFDITKRLDAELFRRRVESVVGKADSDNPPPAEGLPADYLQWFPLDSPSEHSLLIQPSSGVVTDVVEFVRHWVAHSSKNTLAIFGNKGSGKSTLLRMGEYECRALGETLQITIPPKLQSAAQVREFFNAQLGYDTSSIRTDAEAKRRIVFLDEAHNLFLAHPGGFDGYREMRKILMETAATHCWCAAFNNHSWQYLNGVFSSVLGWQQVIAMPTFNESDLRQLIMKHHHHAHYALSYDAIISAAQSPDETGALNQVETQFFRLLWGQSKGNPRAGLVLWLSSLRVGQDGRLHVSIPQHRAPRALMSLSDNHLFVHAAVVRHENISMAELMEVTQFPETIIRDALRHSEDHRILFHTADGRYRITPLAQYSVTQLLVGRNFLYE